MQWEYLKVQLENPNAENFAGACAKYGLEGWELCCPVTFMEQMARMSAKGILEKSQPTSTTYVFFKRPLAPGDVRELETVTTHEDYPNLLPPKQN